VARKDLGKLQPLCENLQQLHQEGLTRMHLLQTFFGCWIKQLRQQRTKMWKYLGPSYPDCSSSEELTVAKVEAQIHKVLDLRVNLNPSSSPVPLHTQPQFWRLSQFYLFTMLAILRRVMAVAAASCGMPTRPQMPPGGDETPLQ
jgi:hypothetical protein